MGYTHMMVRSVILGQKSKKTNGKNTVEENDPDNIFACPVTNGDTEVPAKEEAEKVIEEIKEEKAAKEEAEKVIEEKAAKEEAEETSIIAGNNIVDAEPEEKPVTEENKPKKRGRKTNK